MKSFFKKIGIFLGAVAIVAACQDDDKSFGDIQAPSNLVIDYDIAGYDATTAPNGDGTGNVTFRATADNAISYKFTFSDGTSQNAPTGEFTKRFSQNGVHTYTVTAIAYGRGGIATTATVDVTVLSNFDDPASVQFLTGGTSKTWYWAAALPGHLGVGPNDGNTATNWLPTYYAATPFEKAASPDSSCLYDNQLTFTKQGNQILYTLNNGGRTFFNAAYNSIGGSTSTSDQCSPYDTSGQKIVQLSPSTSLVAPENTTGTMMSFSDGGFMGYYIGTSNYEILEITDTKMVVRAVMGNNNSLAWYHIFSTDSPNATPEPEYNNLVWQDEFNTDGAPDASKWVAEIGNNNGWGNNEAQYYRAENAVVQGGSLKITAKKETFGGFNYTSARLKTEGKFDFKYGKVEIRAKLPSGGGTWPALWMLGSDYTTNPWPASGEIDIMEHVGNQPNVIHGTLHYPGASGGNANTGSTTINNATGDFHLYSVIWSPTKIRFLVDGVVFKTFINSPGTVFNHNFFMIFNVAMGGNMGGAIDPAFLQGTMEVDYVRVYQQ